VTTVADTSAPHLGVSPRRARIIMVLLVACSVSWRKGVYYSGGLDVVVAGKGVLALLALGLAVDASLRVRRPQAIGARTVALIAAYLCATAFGAYASGDPTASWILVVRVVILATTVLLLVRSCRPAEVVDALTRALLTVGLVAAVTGLPGYPAEHRLWGGVPALSPNELALLCGAPLLVLLWRNVCDVGRRYDAPLAAVLLVIVWLTGSRTGLAGLVLAAVVLVVQAPRLSRPMAAAIVLATTAVIAVALLTGAVEQYFGRSNEGSVTTLNSRTIAWSAAFAAPENAWQQWFGGGLAVKKIAVSGQYWDQQGLDSSWVSAFVQAGTAGLVILGIWTITTLVSSFRTPAPGRLLLSALAVMLVLRSVLESGLVDASPSFLTFLVVSLLVDAARRPGALMLVPLDRVGRELEVQQLPRSSVPSAEVAGPGLDAELARDSSR